MNKIEAAFKKRENLKEEQRKNITRKRIIYTLGFVLFALCALIIVCFVDMFI